MSLITMGKATESVRFLDDVDLTFSLDNRSSSSQQMTNIEISARPIVFRASYRDITMITSILNKAIERYGRSQESLKQQKEEDGKPMENSSLRQPVKDQELSSKSDQSHLRFKGGARVLMSKEQVSLIFYSLKNCYSQK